MVEMFSIAVLIAAELGFVRMPFSALFLKFRVSMFGYVISAAPLVVAVRGSQYQLSIRILH